MNKYVNYEDLHWGSPIKMKLHNEYRNMNKIRDKAFYLTFGNVNSRQLLK